MPVYVYVCDKCGERREELESIAAPREHPCPLASSEKIEGAGFHGPCGGTMKRVPASFGFNFNCPMPTYRKGQ